MPDPYETSSVIIIADIETRRKKRTIIMSVFLLFLVLVVFFSFVVVEVVEVSVFGVETATFSTAHLYFY